MFGDTAAAADSALIRRVRYLAALIAGVASVLAFAPFDQSWVAPVAVAVLFWTWTGLTPRPAALAGFAYGCGLFLGGTYWTYISIRVFGEAPAALAVFLMLGLVALMAAYYAGLGYVARRWLFPHGGVAMLLLWPAAWMLSEWLRSWVMTGFPWLSLGYSQLDTPLAGFAPVLGVFGVSLAGVMSAGAILLLRRPLSQAGICALAVLAVLWGGGAALRNVEWTEPADKPISVSLVQGAISQDRKWLVEERLPTLRLYRELVDAELGRDLIVLPEAAIPLLMHRAAGYLDALATAARNEGSEIVLGILRRARSDGPVFNSIVVLGETPQIYDKRHLVPFGEYFPVPGFVRDWMRLLSLPYSDLGVGGARQPVLQTTVAALAPSICYEDAFGEQMLAFLPQAGMLVNVSNDAWFGDSIAPHQHLQIARMRSVESGRATLRATNTGISAVIDHHGKLLAQSPQFEVSVLRADVSVRTGATPFVRFGNLAVVALALVLIAAGTALGRRQVVSGRRR